MSLPPDARVMLVEDDATMQAVLRTLLEMEGFQVVQSPLNASLEDMVSAIRQANANVLLLDVHLRGINGIDVLRALREDPHGPPLRVVMTSGMDRKDESIAAGADDFLMKPYMPDELIRKLRGEQPV